MLGDKTNQSFYMKKGEGEIRILLALTELSNMAEMANGIP